MNIREAKEQIEHAVKLYLEKDEKGRYIIPTEKQRPVFLMGAPGIGKTAIMEQVAQERSCFIYYHASHKAECTGTSIHCRKGVWRRKISGI